MAHIRSENAALHVENNVSILRRFLGEERVATVLGLKNPRQARGRRFLRGGVPG